MDGQQHEFTVEEFTKTAAKNLIQGPDNLRTIDPGGMPTVELCHQLLQKVVDQFGLAVRKGKKSTAFNEWVKKHAVDRNDAAAFLFSATLVGSTADRALEAQKELGESFADLIRCIHLVRVQRDFLHGVTDLLAGRSNAALGSLRVQLETLSIVKLVGDDPPLAKRWMDASTGPSGQEFFKYFQPKMKGLVRQWGLEHFYETASVSALHSRVDGILGSFVAAGGATLADGGVELSLMSLDANEPGEFFLSVCHFMRFYQRVCGQLSVIVPEVADNHKLIRLYQMFRDGVDERWRVLKAKYPQLADARPTSGEL